jgi:hypothetical protein
MQASAVKQEVNRRTSPLSVPMFSWALSLNSGDGQEGDLEKRGIDV